MTSSNDIRGWILTAISALACCVGACIICVDVFVRQFPGMRDFKIAESDAFLSASLSLSAGVILFSSLYSILPSSKTYLNNGGYSPKAASFLLIGLFLAGVFGIRILSKILHRFIPSHVVDCDHTHDEEADKGQAGEMSEQGQDGETNHSHTYTKPQTPQANGTTETTPLLSQPSNPGQPQRTITAPAGSVSRASQVNGFVTAPSSRRASSNFKRSISRTFSKYVSSQKEECDENGPCMGFSDPCGQDCFKIVQRRNTLMPHNTTLNHKTPLWHRASSEYRFQSSVPDSAVPNSDSNTGSRSPHNTAELRLGVESDTTKTGQPKNSTIHHHHHPEHEHQQQKGGNSHDLDHSHNHTSATDHHHHVPTNAFLSIGLQTSIAIALHKAPEGFITYATNHANPQLGFSVFIALFIHNITEGFALSLPLFLALHSRLKAILWASILGGLSQPLGAGVAALWFKFSDESGHLAPNEKIYGGLFAITAGIMASVALSLMSESLQLSHNRNTCIVFAFVGMGLLGISVALTAT